MTLRERLAELEKSYREVKKAMSWLLVMDERLSKSDKRRCPACGKQFKWKALEPEQVREIGRKWRPGVPGFARRLAKKYGVSVRTIRDAVNSNVGPGVDGDDVRLGHEEEKR